MFPENQCLTFQGEFQLSIWIRTLFGRNVRLGKRGAAGGPSGMTRVHPRPSSDARCSWWLNPSPEVLFRRSVVQIVKLGWVAALCARGLGESEELWQK